MNSLQDLLVASLDLLNAMVYVVVALALIFFLWGMAMFILNAGNEEKRKEGTQKMLWGIIALTVMVGIWGIVTLLVDAFGIEQVGELFLP